VTDPKRLVEDGDLGSSLLSSARGDAPSMGARRKTAAALGLAAGLAAVTTTTTTAASAGTAATAGTAAKMATTSVWLKLALGGIVAAATVGGGGSLRDTTVATPPVSTPPVSTVVENVAPKSTATAPITNAPTTTPADLPEAKPTAVPTSIAPAPAHHAKPTGAMRTDAPPSPAPESALVRETRSLDAARAALQRGDASGAIAQLDRHDREFPSGSLKMEAAVLRVDALSARGDKKGAEALARQLLARDPSGPHAKHLRRMAGEADP
jgi:hypothetical protein